MKEAERYKGFLRRKLEHGAVTENGKIAFPDYGYNFRMSEIQAAMGSVQIRKLDRIVADRNETRNIFIRELEPYGFIPQKIDTGVEYNMQSLVFLVPETCDRDDLVMKLKEHDIETTIGTYSLSGLDYYLKKYKRINENGYFLYENTITLPCYSGIPVAEIIESVKKIFN